MHSPVDSPRLGVLTLNALVTGLSLACGVVSADSGAESKALADMSIEQLMNESVTSVSKRAERKNEAASAIAVISQEDLERSGAKSIPEALRLVPGMDVAQMGPSSWAVSARGFQSEFANKLLVLIDGRSVYTPAFSGVYWDVQDTLLEDIERIEVIRGPGAAVWGANAVNGVINITTKSAEATQGALGVVSGGTERFASVAGRYGDKFNDETFLRVYAKYDLYDEFSQRGGNSQPDGLWETVRGGFRMDWLPSQVSHGTLQGDLYAGENDAKSVGGGNVLGRWTRTFSDSSELSVQTYYDRTYRDSGTSIETRNTFDLDCQHSFAWGERQRFVWGLGYNLSCDDLRGHDSSTNSAPGNVMGFSPSSLNAQTASGFVQDTIGLVQDRLDLTLGSKLEHNDYTGVEYQPSGRLAWKLADRQTLWGAVSRAVRTPNRYDTSLNTTGLHGNPDLLSEVLVAYELGYRIEPSSQFSVDVTAYYNVYDEIVGRVTSSSSGQPGGSQPGGGGQPGNPPTGGPGGPGGGSATIENSISGDSIGAELSLDWKPIRDWRLTPFYSYTYCSFDTPASTESIVTLDAPRHQVGLRSALDFARNWQLDVTGRYVDEWRAQNVPAYVTCDVRLAWRLTPHFTLSLVGQNLVEAKHREVGRDTEVPRSVYLKATVKF